VKTAFETLELQPFLYVSPADLPKLKAHHLKLSRKFHPDRFIDRPPEERQNAEEKSAEINRAAREILDRWDRLENTLKLLNVSLNSNREAKIPDLAMEYFQVQEEIEENESGAGEVTANFLSKLERIQRECDDELDTTSKAFPISFDENSKSATEASWPPSPQVVQRLLELYQRRNYIKRMIQNLDPSEKAGRL